MRRRAVVTILLAVMVGAGAFAVPSRASVASATPPANDVYLWGVYNYFAHPYRGFAHFSPAALDPTSKRNDLRFGGTNGNQAMNVEIGEIGGPNIAAGVSQLHVSVFTFGDGCDDTTWVAIDDIAFDGSGAPTRIAVHFALQCPDTPGYSFTVSGSINSNVAEPAHDVGSVGLHWPSVYQTPVVGVPVTIRNPSPTALPMQSVTTSTTHFKVTNDACSGTTVQPGGSCTVRVVPVASGPLGTQSASLLIADGMSSASGHGASELPMSADFESVPSNTHFLVDPTLHPLPGGTYPLVGDFDGNGAQDIFFYGKGAVPSKIWLSLPGRRFGSVFSNAAGDYEPLVGDFDGNGRSDIFWYAPGTEPDPIWYDVTRTLGSVTQSVNGKYDPLVGDLNGDGIDDILWWAPGPAPDSVWYGQKNQTFVSRPLTINGNYQFIDGGDFNGDGKIDLLWWNPGVVSHPLWLSNANGTWTSSHWDAPAADSFPMAVYADGDALTDLLWYGTGSVADALDLSTNHYAPQPLTINGDYDPLWGVFDGNNQYLTDVLWWSTASNAPPDPFWSANGHGFTNRGNTAAHVNPNRWFPISGQFQAGSVAGYGQGDGIDTLWAPAVSYNDPRIMWWSIDVDGTSHPDPYARLRSPFVSPRRSLSLRGPGRCGAHAPRELRAACTVP